MLVVVYLAPDGRHHRGHAQCSDNRWHSQCDDRHSQCHSGMDVTNVPIRDRTYIPTRSRLTVDQKLLSREMIVVTACDDVGEHIRVWRAPGDSRHLSSGNHVWSVDVMEGSESGAGTPLCVLTACGTAVYVAWFRYRGAVSG